MANTTQCVQLQKNEIYRHNSCGDFQKFYRRPLIPFLNVEVPKLKLPNYLEHKTVEQLVQNAEEHYMLPSRLEYVQNTGTQTDYRESDCQTSPWEPPYKIAPGHNPEVLTLAHLTWKQGLPVGMHEVEIINRLRMKRAWEAILPPMDTEAHIKLRTSIIGTLEAENWSFREAEIEFIMNMRMQLAEKIMEIRDNEWDRKRHERFTRVGSSLEQRRDKEIKSIRQKFRRELRKLDVKYRCKTGKRYKRQDIIKLHVDRASELYAPQIRFGEDPRRRHEVLYKRSVRQDFIDSAEKKTTRPSSLPTIKELKSIKPKPKPGELCVRETKWNDKKLEELYEELRRIRLNLPPSESICLLERKQKPQSTPLTPLRQGGQNILDSILHQSAILIQKSIRGRAVQNMMVEGRERCRELIEELRTTHALQDHDKKILQKQEAKKLDMQREQNYRQEQESRLNEILSSLEGMTVSAMLDFLGKELLKLQNERRAHAFAMLAERERSKREAAEAGRRQKELQRRRELDEIFRQMVKVNQDSVEAYLEDIVKESIDWVSEKEAKEYVMTLADKIDRVSKYAAENTAELDEEEMVSDMVYNFVLPEVEKEIMRKKIRNKQQGYLRIAHQAIYSQVMDLPPDEESKFEEFKSPGEAEVNDTSLHTVMIEAPLAKAEENIIQEDYKNEVDIVVNQIMSYVNPDENEDIIRDILKDVTTNALEYNQAESLNEFSISTNLTSSDTP